MPAPLKLEGHRFGKLVAVEPVYHDGRRKWRCQCDCGNESVVITDNLTSGNSTACGHCRAPVAGNLKHGHSSPSARTDTYRTWLSMRRRCRDTKRQGAKYYVLRGITIDPQWDDYANFYADMGDRPAGMTLDRIDNDKGYSKENCRWATPLMQTRNRRLRSKDGYTTG